MNDINIENKFLGSLDIKSLYTIIPVTKCIKRFEFHLKKNKRLHPFTYSENNQNLYIMEETFWCFL